MKNQSLSRKSLSKLYKYRDLYKVMLNEGCGNLKTYASIIADYIIVIKEIKKREKVIK